MNLSMTRGGNAYYYMTDGLGSVRNVVESDEDVANTYDYYAFGNTLGTPTTSVTNPFEYTGREFEDGSVNTTFYYRNRYYMSSLGIFTSRDAMWADEARGWGYVGNGPTHWVDPYGFDVFGALPKYGPAPSPGDGYWEYPPSPAPRKPDASVADISFTMYLVCLGMFGDGIRTGYMAPWSSGSEYKHCGAYCAEMNKRLKDAYAHGDLPPNWRPPDDTKNPSQWTVGSCTLTIVSNCVEGHVKWGLDCGAAGSWDFDPYEDSQSNFPFEQCPGMRPRPCDPGDGYIPDDKLPKVR